MDPHEKASNNSSTEADIAVIGAGVIGVASALLLSRQGWRVLVLDKQDPGMGASYGNAGHMATEQVFPIANASILMQLPKMLMDPMGPLRLDWKYLPKALPWFTRLIWNLRQTPYQASATGIRALNEVSLDAWRRLLDSVGSRHLLKEDGSFLIYEKESSLQEIETLQKTLEAQQVPSERWHGDAIREVAPQLSNKIQGGLFFPETAHVMNPWQVINTLVMAATRQGVQFRQCEVQSGEVNQHGVKLLMENSPSIKVKKIIVACGAHSAPLIADLTGAKVPLDTERGYHLMLPSEQARLPIAVTSLERRFIMTQMEEGLRLAGTVEFAGLQNPPNMERAWQLLRLSQGLFKTDLDATGATPWMGFRPTLPDSLPIIDSVKGGKVMLAFGHHHLGLTQAAVTAELIVKLASHGGASFVEGDGSLPDLAPYRLSRFSSLSDLG